MAIKVPIVFSTDNNYVMQTGVAIMTLLESARTTTTYDVYVLVNNDVTEKNKQLLYDQVKVFPGHSIKFISVGDTFNNSFEIRNISTAAYYRLLIPWLLPQYDKVLYSDVDVVFRIDLTDVYNLELNNNLFAGVPAVAFRLNNTSQKYLTQLGLTPKEYINSGFLVINSKAQRELNLKERFVEEAKKKYLFQDQDIINIVGKNKIIFLSPTYCITPVFYEIVIAGNMELLEFYTDPSLLPNNPNRNDCISLYKQGKNCILHYAGPKPWATFTQAWRDWWDSYRRSIFYNPDFEIRISYSILHPTVNWRSILHQIRQKLDF